MGEPCHERGDRREIFGRTRALLRLPQLRLLGRELARQVAARGGKFAIEVGQPFIVPFDVRIHRELRVEQQQLDQRGERCLRALPLATTVLGDQRRQQREVQRVGGEVVAGTESDPRMDLPDADPVLDVAFVDRRTGEAQQIGSLLGEHPGLYGWVVQEDPRLVERKQVPVEGGDETVRMPLQQRRQLLQQAALALREAEKSEPVVDLFLQDEPSILLALARSKGARCSAKGSISTAEEAVQ